MKYFTKSVFAVLAIMASVSTASAQDYTNPEEWVELVPEMWHEWSNPGDPATCTKEAEIIGEVTPVWNLNTDMGGGGCICGAENVTWNQYVDISDYDKIIIFGTGGPGMRVMCNRTVHEGSWKQHIVGFTEDNEFWDATLEALVIDVASFKTKTLDGGSGDDYNTGDERVDDFVHLHCLKNAWGGQFPVNVSAAYLWKSGGSTGIKTVKADAADGAYYNLAGQRVANPQKGLYIHNGKTMIIK